MAIDLEIPRKFTVLIGQAHQVAAERAPARSGRSIADATDIVARTNNASSR